MYIILQSCVISVYSGITIMLVQTGAAPGGNQVVSVDPPNPAASRNPPSPPYSVTFGDGYNGGLGAPPDVVGLVAMPV